MARRVRRAAIAALACGLAPACRDRPVERPSAPPSPRRIVVDNIHAPFRDPANGLGRGDFRYQSLHGMARLFDHMAANGYPFRFVTREEAPAIASEVLRDADVFFIDLLALECTDYTPDEIVTLHRWIENGGGLLVAADHTNVYDNARRANAILEPLGIRIAYSTAIDAVPEFANPEGSFLKVRRFGDHPITRGVRSITFMGGATLATEHGIAFLSDQGFADLWNETRPPRFLGNWKRDPGESAGRLPLLAARRWGEGRIAVLGDENILGNQQLFMADNFELATNLFAWLAGDDVAPAGQHAEPRSELRVGFDLEDTDWNVYGDNCDFYHPFFVTFNQTPGVVARGALDLDGRYDVLVFTDPLRPLGRDALAAVRRHLSQHGTVVILTDVVRARAGARQLFAELVPEIQIQGRSSFDIGSLPSGDRVSTTTADAEWPAVSSLMDVAGLTVGGQEYPQGRRCPWDVGKTRPYLRLLRATGGELLLGAQVGREVVDIARAYPVAGGTVVVFFQDGLFRNETLGWAEHIPTGKTQVAYLVAYRFVDWLMARHRPAAASR